MPALIKASDRAIKQYHDTIRDFNDRRVTHETGRRRAFENLLAETAKSVGWNVTAEESRTRNGKTIRFDAVLEMNALPRGYWEAKDLDDDLDQEIRKKITVGYPTSNIIFEDTRRAVLYQYKKEQARFDLTNPGEVAALLNAFYAYSEPDLENFDQALAAFKAEVPGLAQGLQGVIEAEYKKRGTFTAAFDSFLDLCRRAINPGLAADEVRKMLVQHLLTERLIRKIFDNPDFAHRNAIAAEIERVINALTSQSFSRDDYLRGLNHYYTAIETTAHGLDFREKQGVLNTVYEVFFQGFSAREADTHGIVYTPQPIVEFMCDSVISALDTEFGLRIDSPEVVILDPATGTGNFIARLLERIPAQTLPEVYASRLFANEITLMPYYIAALNVEHAYFERTGTYIPFQGLCYVDTLSLEHNKARPLTGFSEENDQRVWRQGAAPITVIIGNPPYNIGQRNENDNNKNQAYPKLDKRIKETYAKDSAATNKNALYDAYVKFFRWASDRLKESDGIVCYVSNNSFVDQIAFDGMRKRLLLDFTQIYHIDLGGNSRKTGHGEQVSNVFDIRVGVGITIAIKHQSHAERKIYYFRVPETGHKEDKFAWLHGQHDMSHVQWQSLTPDVHNHWITVPGADQFASFMPLGGKETKAQKSTVVQAIFRTYSGGVKTNRDDTVYDFDKLTLSERVEPFIDAYNGEVDRYKRAKKKGESNAEKLNIDSFVDYSRIKWSEGLKNALANGQHATFNTANIRLSMYRPFSKQYLYFDERLNERRYLNHLFFPTTSTEQENRLIWLKVGSEWPMFALMSNCIVDLLPQGGSQCFPFYVYDEDGTNRRENITDWALAQFRTHYGDPAITKWDIFYYAYAALHRPAWRSQFADALKRELPRLPFVGEALNPQPAEPHPLAPSPLTGEGESSASLEVPLAASGEGDLGGEVLASVGDLGGEVPGTADVGGEVNPFHALAAAGRALADLHLKYESLDPFPLKPIIASDVPYTERVEKLKLSRDKTAIVVNPSLTLSGIPPEAFEYVLGNRSAIEWIIDQYQVKGESDPNRRDDPGYIVRLIGQVVRISVETVRIVKGLK